MNIIIESDKRKSGQQAAADGAELIQAAIEARGEANVILATGASQFEMLDALAKAPDIRWDKVNGFHLDEYVGLPITHPASFRQYLWQRFISKLSLPLKSFHYISGEANAKAECERLGRAIRQHPIDVAFVGVGENGHLAFNDPPADFETESPYLVVALDEDCRKQQLGEGWFPSLADVPTHAISMSICQIMKSRAIICTVPDLRKAQAVRNTVIGVVSPRVPASILQQHDQCALYLDPPAASLLDKEMTLQPA